MIEFGVGPVAQRADLLGLAVFVLFAGAGRWSADAETGRSRSRRSRTSARPSGRLRVGAGVALIVVAFAEKLANPEMALAFLAEHPDFNVAALVGLPMGDLEFVRLAGAIEVLFGLLLISGALPQAIVLIAGIPFNATLWFFGTDELLGHLPVYGAMLVLLVYGSHPQLRPAVSALWPFTRAGHGARGASGDRFAVASADALRDDPLRDRRAGRDHHARPARAAQHDRAADARRGRGRRRGARPATSDVKVIVLRGAGRAFCAGYDFGGGFSTGATRSRPTAAGTRARTS